MKQAIKFTILQLVVVAGLGLWMRVLPFIQVPVINFEYLRHAHSHLAFLGWVYGAYFLAFVWFFLPADSFELKHYKSLFWWTQASAAGLFFSFLLDGYGAFSIAFLTIHTGLAYVFIARFLKDLKKTERQVSRLFSRTALLLFFLSSLGPFAIPIIQATAAEVSKGMKLAIHFYLHFQYNGWFVFGLFAILYRIMERDKWAVSADLASIQWALMTFALFPAFFLNTSFPGASAPIAWTVNMAIFLQLAGMILMLAQVWKSRQGRPSRQFFLLKFSLAALTLKFVLELISILPPVAALIDTQNHFLTLGYLHLIFLGSVTPFIFWFFVNGSGMRQENGAVNSGFIIYATGFLGTEIYLFAAGAGFVLPGMAWALMLFSALLVPGVLGLAKPMKSVDSEGFFKVEKRHENSTEDNLCEGRCGVPGSGFL